MTLEIGFLLFPRLTQLDLTGPWEFLSRVPDARAQLVWKTLEPVASDTGLSFRPTVTFADCPSLDLLCIPGGPGINALLNDEEAVAFVRRQGAEARYVTSVCTGALLLGAAGLLKGYKAATHWAAMEFLPAFGATPVQERVVVDRNRITGGGVTAGIDFGLSVVAALAGRDFAERLQLGLEYDPAPPFQAGSPKKARAEIVAAYRKAGEEMRNERAEAVAKAAAELG
jgi:cyclohexyl-isocyanide hydratase